VNTSDQSDSIRFHELLLSLLLPSGFRRSRNYGLTHHRRKILLKRVQLMLHVVIPPATPKVKRPVLCWRCGQPMGIRVIPRTFQITDQGDSPAQTTRSATVCTTRPRRRRTRLPTGEKSPAPDSAKTRANRLGSNANPPGHSPVPSPRR